MDERWNSPVNERERQQITQRNDIEYKILLEIKAS